MGEKKRSTQQSVVKPQLYIHNLRNNPRLHNHPIYCHLVPTHGAAKSPLTSSHVPRPLQPTPPPSLSRSLLLPRIHLRISRLVAKARRAARYPRNDGRTSRLAAEPRRCVTQPTKWGSNRGRARDSLYEAAAAAGGMHNWVEDVWICGKLDGGWLVTGGGSGRLSCERGVEMDGRGYAAFLACGIVLSNQPDPHSQTKEIVQRRAVTCEKNVSMIDAVEKR